MTAHPIYMTSDIYTCNITATLSMRRQLLCLWHHTQYIWHLTWCMNDKTTTVSDITLTVSVYSHPLDWWYDTICMYEIHPLHVRHHRHYLWHHILSCWHHTIVCMSWHPVCLWHHIHYIWCHHIHYILLETHSICHHIYCICHHTHSVEDITPTM